MRLGLRWWHSVCAAGFAGLFPLPVLGVIVHGISVIQSFGTAAPAGGPRLGFLLVEATFAVTLVVAIPGLALSMYADASAIEDPTWAPNARLYGALGLVYPLSLLVAGFYLYRRYHRVGLGSLSVTEPLARDQLVASQWWYSIAVGPVLLLAGIGLFLFPDGSTLTFAGDLYVRIVVLVLFAGTGLTLFTVGLAADLAQVRGSTHDWKPGTRRYTIPSMLVPGAVPLVAVVYLFNRHRHVGTP